MTGEHVEQHAVVIAHQTHTFLIAKPHKSSQHTTQALLYIGGHNLRPKIDDDVVKASYDMQELADILGCDVYGIISSPQGSYSTDFVKGYPEEVQVTELHKIRSVAMMAVLKEMQKSGKIQRTPIDVIGFSDGGILSLLLAFEDPQVFRLIMVVNTPGLDALATRTRYFRALFETWHVFITFSKNMIKKKEDRIRLRFVGKTKSTLSTKESIQRQFAEKHAVVSAHMRHLFPHLFKQNKDLSVRIITTDNDELARSDIVKVAIEEVITPAMQKNVEFTTTGWKVHTMGYFATIRKQKLHDLASWMDEMRKRTRT